jgi:hypothetical protein
MTSDVMNTNNVVRPSRLQTTALNVLRPEAERAEVDVGNVDVAMVLLRQGRMGIQITPQGRQIQSRFSI